MTHALFDDSDFKSLSNNWPQHKEGSHNIDMEERRVQDEIGFTLFVHFLKAHENPIQAANKYITKAIIKQEELRIRFMKIGVLLWHILTKLRIEAYLDAHINIVEIAWLKSYVNFAIFHLNLPYFY